MLETEAQASVRVYESNDLDTNFKLEKATTIEIFDH